MVLTLHRTTKLKRQDIKNGSSCVLSIYISRCRLLWRAKTSVEIFCFLTETVIISSVLKVYFVHNWSDIVHMFLQPHSPDNRALARECKDVKIDRVYIGSCTGGKTEDFMAAAKVLLASVRAIYFNYFYDIISAELLDSLLFHVA